MSFQMLPTKKMTLDDFHIGNAILGNPWPFDAGSPPGIDRAAKGPDPPNEGLQPDSEGPKDDSRSGSRC